MVAMAKNKRRFTDQMIQRLRPPKAGRLEVGDEIVPGLVLRVTPRGVKSFSVIYKVAGEGGVSPTGRQLTGRQHRITLGQYPALGLKNAREKARQILETVSDGLDPRAERQKLNLLRYANTIEAVARRFIEQDAKRNIASWKKIERTLELHVLPKWEGKRRPHLGRTLRWRHGRYFRVSGQHPRANRRGVAGKPDANR